MQKSKTKVTPKFLSVCAVMAAFSIVLGKYLAVNIGENFRFSLENLPLILTGLYFGPAAAAFVGAAADLVGCLMVGYAINPIITFGAVCIGFFAGIAGIIIKKNSSLRIFSALVLSHGIGSVLIKTPGLYIYYGSPFFATLGWRFLIYLGTGLVEFAILFLLTKNRSFEKQMHSFFC
ncbi:MAG: folate family ECF transporter S component [Clostridia bacterium]|nr:folate family ECF transporter S component [Clostridia bacterium]